MTTGPAKDVIFSKLWEEEAEPDNPFAAHACFCSGYDVYGELLQHATLTEYLFLLFKGERPPRQFARALEILAIAIANWEALSTQNVNVGK